DHQDGHHRQVDEEDRAPPEVLQQEPADGLKRLRKRFGRKYRLQFYVLDIGGMIGRLGKRPHTGVAITF
ncbi:PPOX class F420-dependent oxidoreductase, partial [Streptomyces albidoflavus]